MNENSEQFEKIIRKDLEGLDGVVREIRNNIFAQLRANVSQHRTMMTYVAIVAAALASFSLLIFNNSWGCGKTLLFFAIIVLLGMIWLAFSSLQSSLDSEYSDLMKMLDDFSDMHSMVKENITNFLKDRNIERYNRTLKDIKEKFKPTRQRGSGIEFKENIHRVIVKITFPLACILIAISLLLLLIR